MNNRLTAREREHMEQDAERWMPVLGFEGFYEASDMGRVRSVPRLVRFGTRGAMRTTGGVVLSPVMGSRGYPVVNLTRPGVRRQLFLHKVVLEAFTGGRPEGMEACHNNGETTDARLENLRWDTRSGNHKDKRKHGTWQVGEKANNSKLTEEVVIEIRKRGLSAAQAQREYGLSKTNAKRIVRGDTWWYLNEQQVVGSRAQAS